MSIFKKLGEAVGVEAVDVNSQQEKEAKENQHKKEIIDVYWWLRQTLDEAINYYYRSGDFSELEKVVGGNTLTKLKEVLIDYSNKNLVWSMPNRAQVTRPEISVIAEDNNSFTCEEKFYDYSVLQLVDPSNGSVIKESKNNGTPKICQATFTIDPNNPSHYYFVNFYTVALEEG